MSTLKLCSPQGLQIHKLLKNDGSLTAKDIGKRLNIMPNAVYRATDQLLELGVVEKTKDYPIKFAAVTDSSAMGWFLVNAQRNFKEAFDIKPNLLDSVSTPTMSFVRTRANLLVKTNIDTMRAVKTINFIASGLEIPADTIASYQRAASRGVKVRALLQKNDFISRNEIQKWLKLGIDIRYLDDLGIRMFLFDSEIAYLTSYKETKKEEAFGLRFKYAPLGIMLNELFEQKWRAAGA